MALMKLLTDFNKEDIQEGIRIEGEYYPETRYEPAEYPEVYVDSDISGEELDDDDIYELDGVYMSGDEAIDMFLKDYCRELDPEEALYQEAQNYYRTTYDWGDEDFLDKEGNLLPIYLNLDSQGEEDKFIAGRDGGDKDWLLDIICEVTGCNHPSIDDIELPDYEPDYDDYSFEESLEEDKVEYVFSIAFRTNHDGDYEEDTLYFEAPKNAEEDDLWDYAANAVEDAYGNVEWEFTSTPCLK